MKASEFFTPNLQSLIDEINERCNSTIEEDHPENYDYYENFNKYIFALQNAREILEKALNE